MASRLSIKQLKEKCTELNKRLVRVESGKCMGIEKKDDKYVLFFMQSNLDKKYGLFIGNLSECMTYLNGVENGLKLCTYNGE